MANGNQNQSGGLGDLFNNQSFLQFLAQAGTEFDPQGIGGMLGRPTSQYIQRESTANTLNQMMEMLGGNNNLTGVDMKPDGTISLKSQPGSQEPSRSGLATDQGNNQATETLQQGSGLALEGLEATLDGILKGLFPDMGGE